MLHQVQFIDEITAKLFQIFDFLPTQGLRAICDVLNNLFTDGPINAVEGRSSGSGTDATLGTEESSTDPQSQKVGLFLAKSKQPNKMI